MSSRQISRTAADLARYAWPSIGAAIATILIKDVAWLLTGSVGLLSDALESLVNLAGAVRALAMLSIAARPADLDIPTVTAHLEPREDPVSLEDEELERR